MPWALLVVGCAVMLSNPGWCYGEPIGWQDDEQDSSADFLPSNWQQQNLADKPWRRALQESKRALSVLSRWKPLTSAFSSAVGPMDTRRFSARSAAFPREHGRALLRPLGQPLRWGR